MSEIREFDASREDEEGGDSSDESSEWPNNSMSLIVAISHLHHIFRQSAGATSSTRRCGGANIPRKCKIARYTQKHQCLHPEPQCCDHKNTNAATTKTPMPTPKNTNAATTKTPMPTLKNPNASTTKTPMPTLKNPDAATTKTPMPTRENPIDCTHDVAAAQCLHT
jgi:hypothetical protein